MEIFRELKRGFCIEIEARRFATWGEAAAAKKAAQEAFDKMEDAHFEFVAAKDEVEDDPADELYLDGPLADWIEMLRKWAA